jgi:hypothetical protein
MEGLIEAQVGVQGSEHGDGDRWASMSRNGKPMPPVFISYSHEDKKYLDLLETHLGPLRREGVVDYWADTRIVPGSDWKVEIGKALSAAKVAVLLVSPKFLDSDFIANDELPELLTAAEKRGTVIIPLILSPSRFLQTPSLARFQSINPPERHLARLNKWQRDEVMVKATEAIRQAVEDSAGGVQEVSDATGGRSESAPDRVATSDWPASPARSDDVPQPDDAIWSDTDSRDAGSFGPQVALILDNHEDISVFPEDWQSRGTYDFLYRKHQLLVADRDLERVLMALSHGNAHGEVVETVHGVNVLSGNFDAIPELQRLDATLGIGVATPNHVFSLGLLSPRTEPTPPAGQSPELWPPLASSSERIEATVALVDSGFLADAFSHTWLEGVRADPWDIEDPDWWPAPDGFIDPYAGHGTFAAGLIRCMAPTASVEVYQMYDTAGVADEVTLIRQVADVLATTPDVIDFSGGGYTRGSVPPKSFVEFYDRQLRQQKGTLFLSSAGDDGRRTAFWPAAFPWAVSVGALDSTRRQRAAFSNHGPWVDVYALGESLVNAYGTGAYRSIFNPNEVRNFDGLGEWSGTAFATALVAGLVAGRMGRSREKAPQAAESLLADLRADREGSAYTYLA